MKIKREKAIGWQMVNIDGISHVLYMHKIFMIKVTS